MMTTQRQPPAPSPLVAVALTLRQPPAPSPLVAVVLTLLLALGLAGSCCRFTAAAADAGSLPIEVRFSPRGGCCEEVVKRIDAAKTSIYVRAYGFTSPPIGESLIRAVKRGIAVRVLCDRSERANKYSQAPAVSEAGSEVKFDAEHPISHSKVIVIDERISLVGSYNWTKQAENNAETMLTITDRTIAKQLIADFDKHSDHSNE